MTSPVQFLAIALACAVAQPALAQQKFENLDRIDSLVAMTVGANMGEPGGPLAPVDRRLRLAACPTTPSVEGPIFGAAMVKCDALGWRIRVPLVAEFLTDVREVAHNREHRTMTGWYKGRHITATSTGMGCPSTAIAVEELARVGVTSFIRVGSSAGLQPGIAPGDLLVSEGSFRNDGTTDAYLPKGFPAVPDLALTMALARHSERLAAASGTRSHTGISVSDDAFYAETPEWIGQLNRMGILNVEMEASALYIVARMRGLRAGMVCACSSNLVDGASLYDEKNNALKDGWMRSIEAALETAVELEL